MPPDSGLSPDQRKYAIRLLAFGFHQRFPAHEGNPPDSADLIGAENALTSLESEFVVGKQPAEVGLLKGLLRDWLVTAYRLETGETSPPIDDLLARTAAVLGGAV